MRSPVVRRSPSAQQTLVRRDDRVQRLFGFAAAQIVDPVGFPRTRLEVSVLDRHLLPGPQETAKTGLARLEHDDLSSATRTRLSANVEGRSHCTPVLAPSTPRRSSGRTRSISVAHSKTPPRASHSRVRAASAFLLPSCAWQCAPPWGTCRCGIASCLRDNLGAPPF